MKTFGEKKAFLFLLQKTKQNKKQAFLSLNLPKGNPCLSTHLQKKEIACLFSGQQIKPLRFMYDLKVKGTSLFKDILMYVCPLESNFFSPFRKHVYTHI